jgi:hypothetical protein
MRFSNFWSINVLYFDTFSIVKVAFFGISIFFQTIFAN